MVLSLGRRLALPLAVLVAGFALAGCAGLPAGVDGNLTNDWPAMAQAKISVPVSGVCYQTAISPNFAEGDEATVPCTGPHGDETVFVGAFTGADAARSSPPPKGGVALATAFGLCRKNATDYLGDDFAIGALDLTLVMPNTPAWTGGARWFRCDLFRYSNLNFNQSATQVSNSAKDGLRGTRPLAVTCVNATDDGKGSITD